MELYSLSFFVFLFIVMAVYYIAPQRFRWVVLLVASYYFYGTFKVHYLFLLAFSTLVAYFTARLMEKQSERSGRVKYLLLSLLCNLGLLFVFKYFNFFSSTVINLLFTDNVSHGSYMLRLAVPVGISFYVFQLVSYSIDVYRGNKTAEKHLGMFALYVAFFPRILAGPIERAKQFLSQLHESRRWDWEQATNGFKLMVWGLFKKVVVADRLAAFVDVVFNNPSHYEGPSLALALFLYSFQLYCDFSGYTDIAIGISQAFGLKLMENFDRPYTSRSIAEFWRRWHISLSTWLRDYLYIPLGGNRVAAERLYVNLIVVFLICGLWHGASWTFIVWGFIHGSYLVLGLITRNVRSGIAHSIGLDSVPLLHKGMQIVVTFILVSLAWAFFRSDSLYDGVYIIAHLHTGWSDILSANAIDRLIFLGKPRTEFVIAISSLVFVWVIHFLETHSTMRTMFSGKPVVFRWPVYYILVTAILLLSAPGPQKFIYFQF
jgi:D-alanyl-lipoteichoic acid acyltransferase DltB (MBOAT superfamily)